MRVRLNREAFLRARGAWPQLCCGCGGPPTTTYPAWIRKSSAVHIAAGLGGHGARWTTFTLGLPACASCVQRARWIPIAWAVVAALLFFGGLWAAKAGIRFEADGTPIEGFTKWFRLSLLACVPVLVLLGPGLFLVLQRRASPALISELTAESGDAPESIELDCGSEAFALGVERIDGR